jgi:quinol monooxygenase YgiN
MGVILTGHIDVPPERLTDIRAALVDHIALTRAEPGCLRFDVTENAEMAGRLMVSEEFVDAEAFAAHQARAKASDWGGSSAGLVRDYVVEGL